MCQSPEFCGRNIHANPCTYKPINMYIMTWIKLQTHMCTHCQSTSDNIYNFGRPLFPNHPSCDISSHPKWVSPVQMMVDLSVGKALPQMGLPQSSLYLSSLITYRTMLICYISPISRRSTVSKQSFVPKTKLTIGKHVLCSGSNNLELPITIKS